MVKGSFKDIGRWPVVGEIVDIELVGLRQELARVRKVKKKTGSVALDPTPSDIERGSFGVEIGWGWVLPVGTRKGRDGAD